MTDFFDNNAVGGDSHLQFLNWAVDQNGAYDFTGDARGYTWGVYSEYQSVKWGLRFAEALMSGPQNGGPLVWNLRKANTSNAEFELYRAVLNKKDGIVRVLLYLNHGNMGVYQEANEQYLAGKVSHPDIDNHPFKVTAKHGFGINAEQALTSSVTLYSRYGWNDGKTESWSFTEIDNAVSGGAGFSGHMWKRNNDRAGIAFASDVFRVNTRVILRWEGWDLFLVTAGSNMDARILSRPITLLTSGEGSIWGRICNMLSIQAITGFADPYLLLRFDCTRNCRRL